ncbi:MAG: TIGR04053 family radical SAM/SPASM domain-containing protein [Candidatus Omnitrophica bacterium]|nr:TIGR04053 family radical SAM/SPASM domain-containing protein [Candidatus Omnitrophota bacterium]
MFEPDIDFAKRPFLVIWETTRACDLSCVHCRASAEREPLPGELNHGEALKLIRGVAHMGTPIFIFSGGDCLKRNDLFELIAYAKNCGLRTGAIPAVTPAITRECLKELKESGLDQVAFSLDAANAQEHDSFRRTHGVFQKTLEAIRVSQEEGLRVQINSLINLHNILHLDDLIELVKLSGIVFWEVFFLVPTGRGQELGLLEQNRVHQVFEKIYALEREQRFVIKITEAPHYKRFCIEKEKSAPYLSLPSRMPSRNGNDKSAIRRAPQTVNSGKGFLFVSSQGEIMPSGFLPISCGNIRKNSLQEIYQNSPLFKNLRNTSLLKGRCGQCRFREECGGSRARAYALSGDYYAEDSLCSYQN